jgi:hypothetical protein
MLHHGRGGYRTIGLLLESWVWTRLLMLLELTGEKLWCESLLGDSLRMHGHLLGLRKHVLSVLVDGDLATHGRVHCWIQARGVLDYVGRLSW